MDYQTLTLGQGVLISIYGFITVFIMLTLLMFIIQVLSKIVVEIETKNESKPQTSNIDSVEHIESEPKEFAGEIKLIDVDEKTAACIMAIISDETKIPLDQLIFKSIRAIEEGN